MDAPSGGVAGTKKKKNRKNKNRNKFKQRESHSGAHAGQAVGQPPAVAKAGVSKVKSKKHSQKNPILSQGSALGADNQAQQQEQQQQQLGRQQQLQKPHKQKAQTFQHQAASRAQTKGGVSGKGSGSLLEKMRQRLQGGRFRWLNEKLYTCEGAEALDIMRQEPDLYTQYHEGFREQTKGWPTQPVEVAIRWLSGKPPGWVVADLGCGDARLAASVAQNVHSFDLVATAPGVVACNMAQLPLGPACCDAAVFCLSLMGTDYGDFLAEAARVLRPGGWLWVAEVQSRFVDESGRSVLDTFITAVESLGFEVKSKDLKNPYFFTLQFQKRQQQQAGKKQAAVVAAVVRWPPLRACQYKKR